MGYNMDRLDYEMLARDEARKCEECKNRTEEGCTKWVCEYEPKEGAEDEQQN